MATERDIVRTFLSSSFFAEDEAAPSVARLLELPCDEEERKLLESYAAEEAGHAALIAQHFATNGLELGEPFWVQRLFKLARARPTMLVQMYTIEVMACLFYGAMAARTHDESAKALLRKLLRDEARHIRLVRELLNRELARLTPLQRFKALGIASLFRVGASVTAFVQARHLAPVLGDTGLAMPRKLFRLLSAERAAQPSRPLTWWWAPAAV